MKLCMKFVRMTSGLDFNYTFLESATGAARSLTAVQAAGETILWVMMYRCVPEGQQHYEIEHNPFSKNFGCANWPVAVGAERWCRNSEDDISYGPGAIVMKWAVQVDIDLFSRRYCNCNAGKCTPKVFGKESPPNNADCDKGGAMYGQRNQAIWISTPAKSAHVIHDFFFLGEMAVYALTNSTSTGEAKGVGL
mmetsp:Transcript_74305/g.206374  ORF Transcript_74305/g.206374 Transcript_74305/m.206374 type:complete len:193 (-) Transcript_74305:156-734(-)